MLRSKSGSSMQKTYDECYLVCSTAVYFESQNNESEALRSWKTALEQINYHNAYKVPSAYVPKTETEKALWDSLKKMEIQCRERVDLLEALAQSRKDVQKTDLVGKLRDDRPISQRKNSGQPAAWLGDQTVPPMQYSELPNPGSHLSSRPPTVTRPSNASYQDLSSRSVASPASAPPKLPVPRETISRSPSPDHSKKAFRKTLRPEGRTTKPKMTANQPRKPAPSKAAALAWDIHPRSASIPKPEVDPTIEARLSATAARRSFDSPREADARPNSYIRMPDPADFIPSGHWRDTSLSSQASNVDETMERMSITAAQSQWQPQSSVGYNHAPVPPTRAPPPPPPHTKPLNPVASKVSLPPLPKAPAMSYRNEYPSSASTVPPSLANHILNKAYNQNKSSEDVRSSGITRKPVALPTSVPRKSSYNQQATQNLVSDSDEDRSRKPVSAAKRSKPAHQGGTASITPPSTDVESPESEAAIKSEFDKKAEKLLKNLPKGIDENAAKQILNEIVVKGDEVHWDDVAGLEGAKKALKEAVVYPFLRPDLFMGLREPARGMLLFGPPGTGKTMLARAVATESKSCFFAISASSLTSKWHGDSEKLVRALFGLAKALAPSIIFVDEIDSLLSSRGGGSEHEASRRTKTEFLIQWSDLQRAAAGKDVSIGDASRVLVLAATNCPWDIDEAARRRFVRRQYIPLPETETREKQIRTLVAAQKHSLVDRDVRRLVRMTEGYSGSDITALAKDAAMGPLRHLGEALLYTPMDQIRPIQMSDFEESLVNIRPSVSKKGLEEFEQWARDFGERGG